MVKVAFCYRAHLLPVGLHVAATPSLPAHDRRYAMVT